MENQKSICEWALATFGPLHSGLLIAARAHEEAAELFTKVVASPEQLGHDDRKAIRLEIGDVLVVLYQVAEFYHMSLDDAICQTYWLQASVIEDDKITVAHGILEKFQGLFWQLRFDKTHLHQTLGLLGRLIANLAVLCQIHPGGAVDEKMLINRKRQWVMSGQGIGQHHL